MKDDSREWRGGGLGHYILQPDHQPVEVDMMTWAMWMEGERKKPGGGLWRVGQTTVPGRMFVSTVFLGLDHGWGGGGGPVLFESMAFDRISRHPHDKWSTLGGKRFRLQRKGGRYMREFAQFRYRTWDEAAAGHAELVRLTRRFGKELHALRMAGDTRSLDRLCSKMASEFSPIS